MNDKIKSLISQYERKGSFTYMKLTPSMLASAQQQLGVTIPAQFIDYINSYSHGGIGGIEILGIGFDNSICFLEETLDYRSYGLPENLLVVENCDEWLYCIDVNTNQVVSWSFEDGVRVEFPDFDTFLLQEIQNAIENMQCHNPNFGS